MQKKAVTKHKMKPEKANLRFAKTCQRYVNEGLVLSVDGNASVTVADDHQEEDDETLIVKPSESASGETNTQSTTTTMTHPNTTTTITPEATIRFMRDFRDWQGSTNEVTVTVPEDTIDGSAEDEKDNEIKIVEYTRVLHFPTLIADVRGQLFCNMSEAAKKEWAFAEASIEAVCKAAFQEILFVAAQRAARFHVEKEVKQKKTGSMKTVREVTLSGQDMKEALQQVIVKGVFQHWKLVFSCLEVLKQVDVSSNGGRIMQWLAESAISPSKVNFAKKMITNVISTWKLEGTTSLSNVVFKLKKECKDFVSVLFHKLIAAVYVADVVKQVNASTSTGSTATTGSTGSTGAPSTSTGMASLSTCTGAGVWEYMSHSEPRQLTMDTVLLFAASSRNHRAAAHTCALLDAIADAQDK